MSTEQQQDEPTAERLREVVDAAADGLMLIDAEGRIELINRAAKQMQDTGSVAVEGMTVLSGEWTAIDIDGHPVANADLPSEITRRTGRPLDDVPIGFAFEGGEVRWISISTRPLHAAEGLPCPVVISSRDITAQHATRMAVQAAAEHHRAVLDALQEGVVIMDDADRLQAVNPPAIELLGAEANGIAAADLESTGVTALREDGTRMTADEFPATIAARTGEPVLGEVVSIERRDGQRRWLSVNSRPTTIGGRSAVVASFLDITARHLAERACAESELRLRVTLDSLSEGVILYGPDGRAEISNATARRLLGFDVTARTVDEIVRRRRVVDADGRSLDAGDLRERVRREGMEVDSRIVGLVGDDGGVQWLTISLRPILTDGAKPPYAFVTAFRDVTETRARERSLADAEQRFRGIFSMAPIGMGIVRNGYVLEANQAWADIVGRTTAELEGSKVDDLTFPGDPATIEAAAFLGEGARSAYRVEKRYLHAEGHPVWVQVDLSAVRGTDGQIQYVIVQVQDVTDRRRHQQQLEHIANHDALTGLLNRRGFQHALEDHVRHAGRYGADGAMLMLDLDHFKYVNDTLGHKVGDELIVKAASLLAGRLRESDIVARIGGDEFAILLPHGDREAATTLAKALLAGLREWRLAMDPDHGTAARGLSASIGIAMCVPGASADDLVVNADLAMYDAKEAGRDRWAFYTVAEGGEQPRMKARLSWLARVRRAIEQRAFELYAQPIIDLRDASSVPMYEVLLRMRSDGGELIAPGAFLSIAERVDLIQEIDRLVMEQTIAALAATRVPVCLSVNVSGKSVAGPDLLADIDRQLRATGVAPEALIVEIAETAAIAHLEQARQFATELQRLGCRVAIDDFGAGFGSFTYLKHLPFDFLKIDGEFVTGAVHSRADAVIVDAVRRVAHGLDRAVIAEHCSDAVLVDFLRGQEIDFAQGYHLGRPEPLADVLRRQSRRS